MTCCPSVYVSATSRTTIQLNRAGRPPQEERYPRWIAIAFANQIFASTETCASETQVRARLPPAQSLVRTFPSGSDRRNPPINGVKVGLAIPRQEGFMQTIAADCEHRGAARRENWEHADMAQSLRHSRRVEGFRDAASENSGCEVALQVLGSVPVTSSRPFIGEPR